MGAWAKRWDLGGASQDAILKLLAPAKTTSAAAAGVAGWQRQQGQQQLMGVSLQVVGCSASAVLLVPGTHNARLQPEASWMLPLLCKITG
jgi:hypothetical protein